MGDVKNLAGTNAAKKIKELVKDIDTCMFCTYKGGKITARPMSTAKVDEHGDIWFLADKNSEKIKEIHADHKVELFYGEGHDKFLSVHGKATVSHEKARIKELWTPIAKIWFTEGVDDPNINVLKVSVSEGYYWDTKHGKMVEMAKMAAALVTGKTMDDGIEGKLTK